MNGRRTALGAAVVAAALAAGVMVAAGTSSAAFTLSSSVRANRPALQADQPTPTTWPPDPPDPTPPGPLRVTRATSQAVDWLENRIGAYHDWARRFSGSWITSDGHGLGVGVARPYFASTAPALRRYMARHFPSVRFQVVEMGRSTADLEALQHEIFVFVQGDAASMAPEDVVLGSVGTIVQTNQLLVRVLPGHQDVAARVRARYGSLVVVLNDGEIAHAD